MRIQYLASVSALALVLGTGAALTQSSPDQRIPQRDPNASHTTPNAPAAQRPMQSQPRTDTQTRPSTQQNVQQQPAPAQPAAQQPTSNQNTAQQPAPSNQNTAQQPARLPSAPTGQARQQQQPVQQNAQQPPAQMPARQNAQQQPRPGAPPAAPANQAQRQPTRQQSNVTLNVQQRTRVSRAVAKLNVRPLNNVTFSVAVGTALPRSVSLRPLPVEVVRIVPQYRGYDFVVVSNQIVIVEPRSRHIVAFLPYSSSTRAQAPAGPQRQAVRFSDENRKVIRRAIPAQRQTTGTRARTRITVGQDIPEGIELRDFPETIYREVPTVRQYRYYSNDEGIVVVDPTERRVIDVIE